MRDNCTIMQHCAAYKLLAGNVEGMNTCWICDLGLSQSRNFDDHNNNITEVPMVGVFLQYFAPTFPCFLCSHLSTYIESCAIHLLWTQSILHTDFSGATIRGKGHIFLTLYNLLTSHLPPSNFCSSTVAETCNKSFNIVFIGVYIFVT